MDLLCLFLHLWLDGTQFWLRFACLNRAHGRILFCRLLFFRSFIFFYRPSNHGAKLPIRAFSLNADKGRCLVRPHSCIGVVVFDLTLVLLSSRFLLGGLASRLGFSRRLFLGPWVSCMYFRSRLLLGCLSSNTGLNLGNLLFTLDLHRAQILAVQGF